MYFWFLFCPLPFLWKLVKISRNRLIQMLAVRNAIGNSAHSCDCGFSCTSCKCWQRRKERLWTILPMAQWTFKKSKSSFFINRLERNELSVGEEEMFLRCWQLRLIANICTWWRWQILMGSHKMGDGREKSPRFFSLESTFKASEVGHCEF